MDELLQWVDFNEELNVNPSWPPYLTLLTLYVLCSEYLTLVIAEGRSCTVDTDCGQDYVCVEGAVPIQSRTSLKLLSSSPMGEKVPIHSSIVLQSVVQARRMKFGLSCMNDSDCLGALCDNGYCQRQATQLDPCTVDSECPNDAFCEDSRCTVPGFQQFNRSRTLC